MAEQVLFARQPIFDSKQSVYGYELLFRDGESDRANFFDGDLATKSVLLNAYTQCSAPQVLNGKPGFLNVGRLMLGSLPSFAKEFLVVEVLEHIHHHTDLVEQLVELKKQGFAIALDDFEMVNYSEELINAVDIVKLDVLTMTQTELAAAVDILSQHSVQLLAEKVENYEMFNYCQSLGFDLYQGYFFCRPEIIRGHVIDANKKAIFELIRELYQPEVDISALTKVVKRDVLLSYKLLKLVNSSFYKRSQTVDSLSHAVMMLGVSRIRSWATLVSLGKLNTKPQELQTESLMRAYMCEWLGIKQDEHTSVMCFSAGLLSCLDAWFDQPIEKVLELLPLSTELRDAIVSKKGNTGDIITVVVCYMHSEWDQIDPLQLERLSLNVEELSEAYAFAIAQTDELTQLLNQEGS